MSPIVSDLVPSWHCCLGRFRRYSIAGGSTSLGMGFEKKPMAFPACSLFHAHGWDMNLQLLAPATVHVTSHGAMRCHLSLPQPSWTLNHSGAASTSKHSLLYAVLLVVFYPSNRKVKNTESTLLIFRDPALLSGQFYFQLGLIPPGIPNPCLIFNPFTFI